MIWPFRRKSKKRMARIVIDEPISSSTRVSVLKALKQIEDREFPALIVRIDSPGGTVGDSQEIYSAIKRLKDKGCKVIASFGNISASGGVYIGVASDKIVANPGTITGSIGVIIRGNNLSELLDKIGIKFETVKSGVFKDILSPDKPLSEEGRVLLQGLIDESYKQFTEAVAEGRNLPVEEVRKFKIIEEIKNRLKNTKGKVIEIDGIRVENEKGWILVRASNTQNQLTCRAEALNKEDLFDLTGLIENQLKLSGVEFKFNL